MTEEQSPTETEPVEDIKQPRNKDGTFGKKEKVEPLYSKRNPGDPSRIGSLTNTLTEYRDTLLEQIDIELDEGFEKQPVRKQIEALKNMVSYKKKLTEKSKNEDVQDAQPLDKTGKAKVGGEVPSPTTVHVPSLLERNRADTMIKQARSKTGFRQYRKKWEQG